MQQEQSSENAGNHKKGEDPEPKIKVIWSTTGTAIAIWMFLIVLFFLWIFLPDYVPDRTDRAKVFLESMFSLAIVVVVVVHAVMYYKQASTASRQADIAARQIEITDRPWIAVSVDIVSPLTFERRGAMLKYTIIAKNVGRSPALNTTITARAVIPQVDGNDLFEELRQRQKLICEDINEDILSYIVFPGDHSVRSQDYRFTSHAMPPNDIPFRLYIIGCADYQFVGHERHHQTRFIYEVCRREGGKLEMGENVPADKLETQKHPFGGDYAD